MKFYWIGSESINIEPFNKEAFGPYQNIGAYEQEANVMRRNFVVFDPVSNIYIIGQSFGFTYCWIARWTGGPVGACSNVTANNFVKNLQTILRNNGCIGIQCVSLNYYNLDSKIWEEAFLDNGYVTHGAWATFIISITEEIDQVLSRFQSGLRKNIRRLELHKKISLKIVNNEPLIKDYCKVFNESRERNLLKPIPELENELAKYLLNPYRKYFVLYYDDRPIACQGIIIGNYVVTEVALGISQYSIDNKIYAGDYIKWKIIQWSKESGFHLYDLAGVNPFPSNSKEKGIKDYKAKWGGIYVEYSLWKKSLSPLFKIAEFARNLKKYRT